MNGGQAKVVLLKQPGQITLTVSARADAIHRPDWTQIKVWAGRYPFCISGDCPVAEAYNGTNFVMALAHTFANDKKTETAVYVLNADTAVIADISDVLAKSGDNCWATILPLDQREVLARFKSRCSNDEIRQFEALRTAHTAANRRQALEMVLSRLTAAELHRVGIHQLLTRPPSTPALWEIAWQQNTDPEFATEEAMFHTVLEQAKCQVCTGIGNGGVIAWTVRQEQFFQARDALLAAKRAMLLQRTTVANGPNFVFSTDPKPFLKQQAEAEKRQWQFDNPLTIPQVASVKAQFKLMRPGMTKAEVFSLLGLTRYESQLHSSDPLLWAWDMAHFQLAEGERLVLFFDDTGVGSNTLTFANGAQMEWTDYSSDLSRRLVIRAQLDTVTRDSEAGATWKTTMQWP